MRNESENCGHGRESNPTSSAIAAAALTTELQTYENDDKRDSKVNDVY